MSERGRTEKPNGQDALGLVFCAVGGLFAVSTVFFLGGREPSGGVWTWPILELLYWLGPWAALVLSLGLAVLGSVLFLGASSQPTVRYVGALLSASVGLSFVVGAFHQGGTLGAVFPGLLAGLAGKVLGVGLGLIALWFGLALSLSTKERASSAETLQRMRLATRSDASGVSTEEAALLVTEGPAQTDTAKGAARRAESPRTPVRVETVRPYTAAEGTVPRSSVPDMGRARSTPAASAAAGDMPVEMKRSAPVREVPPLVLETSATEIPPALKPSWEENDERGTPTLTDEIEQEIEEDELEEVGEDLEEEALEAEALVSELATEETRTEDELEELEEDILEESEELEELDEMAEAEEVETRPAAPSPTASWEQVGLFDEEFAQAETAAKRDTDPTPPFDFDAPAPAAVAPVSTPEKLREPPLAAAARSQNEADDRADDEAESAASAVGASEAEALAGSIPQGVRESEGFVLTPRAAPVPAAEPEPRQDEPGERWSRLVFDAGCAILDQNRVAVSMLERRFGIDFDEACRVLDELQQAGLIGPYMGGRTRDILLTREEWLAHAPQAS